MAAYQAIGAASQADSYVNQQSPGTYDLTTSLTVPTWAAATGWTFNGTTQGFKMGGVSPLGAATGWTVLFRGTITAGAKRGAFGYGRTASNHLLFIEHDRWFSRTSATVSISYTAATGSNKVWAYTMSSTASAIYADGVSVATGGGVGTIETSPGFYSVFHSHDGTGGAANYYLGTGQAFAVYNAALSSGDVATISTAMAALTAPSGQPAAIRSVFVPGMMSGGRTVVRPGWGG